MDAVKLRAWWWSRQGLDGRWAGQAPAEALAGAGWMRSVAGSGPYLGLMARCGVTRAEVDAAVARAEIHELPSARGCTYILPAADYALGLRVGEAFADLAMKVARKLGVTDAEVDRLGMKVMAALGKGPLEPDEIKAVVGDAVRNLGEEGKKKGVTTTLPLALGRLQACGEIRRIPVNGRLDQQRYKYAVWRPNPLDGYRLSEAEAQAELARRYFEWTGAASLAEFQWFSGLGVKVSKEAVAGLGLVALEDGSEFLATPAAREELASFRVPKSPQYSLISSLDGLLLLRRNLKSLLSEEDLEQQVAGEKGVGTVGGLMELPNNAIVDRGRVVGLWEYDPASESIAWTSFVKADGGMKAAVRTTELAIREQLGDARSFSLDSPKSRAPRIAALRAMATA